MKILCCTILALVMSQAAPAAAERRCGWLANPTPGNWWLTDADGTWILGVQGGYQTPGDYEIRGYDQNEWVTLYPEGGPNYGHGCACLDVVVDHATKYILSVEDGFYQPLSVCEGDSKLAAPQ